VEPETGFGSGTQQRHNHREDDGSHYAVQDEVECCRQIHQLPFCQGKKQMNREPRQLKLTS